MADRSALESLAEQRGFQVEREEPQAPANTDNLGRLRDMATQRGFEIEAVTTPLEAPTPRQSDVDVVPGPETSFVQRKVPDLIKKAAKAGVAFDKAAPAGHFQASLALGPDRRMKAYRQALSEELGQDVKVRRGDQTGEIEYLDPATERWTLVQPPDDFMSTVEGLAGPGIVMGSEALAGIGAALFTRSPKLTALAGSSGAFVGELTRLNLGRQMGINEGVSDEQIIKEAAKEAGISLAAGAAGTAVLRTGKFVLDAMEGRVTAANVAKKLETPEGGKIFDNVEEAQRVTDRINAVTEEARLRFNLAQQTNDPDLLAQQDVLRRSPQFRSTFGEFEKQQQRALQDFERQINRPYQARVRRPGTGDFAPSTAGDVERRVQDIAGQSVEQRRLRANLGVQMKEAELESASRSIKTRPWEDLGRQLRDVTDAEYQQFRQWADNAAASINDLAGGAEFIPNKATKQVVDDIDQQVKRALFPTLQRPQRSLIGREGAEQAEEIPEEVQFLRQTVLGEEADAQAVQQVTNKLFDPNAQFTFAEAWEAISALKRVERVASKGLSTDAPEVAAVRRLYKALESDLREGAQGTPLAAEYDRFIRAYRREKTRLDEGAVGEIMRKEGGKNGRFVVANEQVFRKFFTPGTDREAQELFEVIKNDPQAMQGMREAIGDFYKRNVGLTEDGRVNLRRHRAFMENFQKPMRVFFNKSEMQQFAKPGQVEKALRAREDARKRAFEEINQSFEASLSKDSSASSVLSIIRDKNDPSRARKLVEILNKNNSPDVLRAVRSEFVKDMRERTAGQFQSGARGLSPAKFDKWLNGTGGDGGWKGVARELFGDQYVEDLQTLNSALKIASREDRFPNRSNTGFWNNTLTNLSRAYLGMFTTAGRSLTALNRIRGRAADHVIAKALMDPDALRDLASLKGVDLRTRKASTILSQLGGSALSESYARSVPPEENGG